MSFPPALNRTPGRRVPKACRSALKPERTVRVRAMPLLLKGISSIRNRRPSRAYDQVRSPPPTQAGGSHDRQESSHCRRMEVFPGGATHGSIQNRCSSPSSFRSLHWARRCGGGGGAAVPIDWRRFGWETSASTDSSAAAGIQVRLCPSDSGGTKQGGNCIWLISGTNRHQLFLSLATYIPCAAHIFLVGQVNRCECGNHDK